MVATSRDTILPAITDQDIYLAFSNVFTGPDAEIRKTKRVKQLVRKAEQQPQVADLLRECEKRHISRKSLCKRIGVLLSAHVFESFAFAKLRFPDLPQSALQAPQAAEGEAPEAEASSSQPLNQAGATGVVPQWSDASDDLDDSEGTYVHLRTPPPALEQNITRPKTSPLSLPSLPPLPFPFVPGHRMLVKAQNLLEQACFDFAKQAMPCVLQKNHWSCAEAVELNLWAKKFKSQRSALADAENKIGLLDRAKFYESIKDIRHTAVHRLPVTAKQLEKFLADGEKLAGILGNELALAVLSSMASEAKRTISDMENHRSMLGAKLAGTAKRIADQRAELDRQEKSAIADMLKSDEEYQELAGVKLEQRLSSAAEQDKLVVVGTSASGAYYADDWSEEEDEEEEEEGEEEEEEEEEGEELYFYSRSKEDDFDFLRVLGIPVM